MSRTLEAKAPSSAIGGADHAGLKNELGCFMMIPTGDLKIDSEYQRPLKGNRVDRMRHEWSWIACGCITVALRGAGSGNYYVIDGQHRVAAAARAEIAELPCLVFETSSHQDEAEGFLDTNTARAPMAVLDRYRALLVVQDPAAVKLAVLLASAGWEPAPMTRANGIRCIAFFLYALKVDEEALRRIWPILVELCADQQAPTKRLASGLFYIERFLTNTSLTERHWRRRLLTVGYETLHKSIDETAAFEGGGGTAVCARGILRAVNKGLRSKLQITATSAAAEDTDQ